MVPLLVEHLLGDVVPFAIHLDLGSEGQDHPPPMYFGLDRSVFQGAVLSFVPFWIHSI
ncbi:hypothetical protein SERLA73DRAFT_81593 [Serpula lacrymans var. lacrymans S7.3]|uniref:Uncharacterized protein n=1 Tax=Serpula lacrymans var. lacrymans (strain S7.3) TaxID=936435 RepID=F8QL37_SERL3|nr:hypothetical protein SERLA73DRAFT_81593 [Serpula lacrymans var. lacrymans S7.3]